MYEIISLPKNPKHYCATEKGFAFLIDNKLYHYDWKNNEFELIDYDACGLSACFYVKKCNGRTIAITYDGKTFGDVTDYSNHYIITFNQLYDLAVNYSVKLKNSRCMFFDSMYNPVVINDNMVYFNKRVFTYDTKIDTTRRTIDNKVFVKDINGNVYINKQVIGNYKFACAYGCIENNYFVDFKDNRIPLKVEEKKIKSVESYGKFTLIHLHGYKDEGIFIFAQSDEAIETYLFDYDTHGNTFAWQTHLNDYIRVFNGETNEEYYVDTKGLFYLLDENALLVSREGTSELYIDGKLYDELNFVPTDLIEWPVFNHYVLKGVNSNHQCCML